MNELFKKDIKIKILSVFIALILWIIVYNRGNPLIDKTYYNIPLKIENEASLGEKGIEIKNNYTKTIDITLRERKDVLDNISNSDFEASVDFSRIDSEDVKSIDINKPICKVNNNNIKIKDYTPKQIDLELAKIKGSIFTIDIIPNVTFKPNYKLLKISMDKDTITLEDEEELIDSVGAVTASLDIKNLDRNITKNVPIKVVNKEGKIITSLSRNKSVTVTVEVAKEVPVVMVVNGVPDADYVEASRSVTPAKVSVTGTPEMLSKITELQTEPINIDNAKQDINTTGIIKLPDGVKLAGDTPKEVTAKVVMEALVIKDINVARSNILLENAVRDQSLTYEIKNDSYMIQLKGRASQLNQIDPAAIAPSIDVNGLTEGNHKLPLIIKLPQQVKLLNEVMIDVKITRIQATGAV